ncbi:AI-2E family transporter [Plasmodiophora brassicae]
MSGPETVIDEVLEQFDDGLAADSMSSGETNATALTEEDVKRQKVQKTFHQLSQMAICIVVGLVLYYDLLIIWPHLGALFWAITWFMILAKPRDFLMDLHHRATSYIVPYRPFIIAALLPIYLGIIAIDPSLFSVIVWTITLLAAIFFLVGNSATVVGSLLLVLVIFLIVMPLAIILKNGADEVNTMVSAIQEFVGSNEEIKQILADFGSSSIYKTVVSYAKSWGMQIPPWDADRAKEQAIALVAWAGQHVSTFLNVSLSLVSRTSNAIVAFVTFLSFLFYLLTEPHMGTIEDLSPFSEADTRNLVKSLKRSVVRTVVCSLLIGVVHAIITYVTFQICGIQFTLILDS